mmetsp:Transcript_20366/g.51657  ORF Transcript_20366/g.51657 Transcript_20366/m.51657 type:complete len:225 (+) Transcript_20366:715-1389(+)
MAAPGVAAIAREVEQAHRLRLTKVGEQVEFVGLEVLADELQLIEPGFSGVARRRRFSPNVAPLERAQKRGEFSRPDVAHGDHLVHEQLAAVRVELGPENRGAELGRAIERAEHAQVQGVAPELAGPLRRSIRLMRPASVWPAPNGLAEPRRVGEARGAAHHHGHVGRRQGPCRARVARRWGGHLHGGRDRAALAAFRAALAAGRALAHRLPSCSSFRVLRHRIR